MEWKCRPSFCCSCQRFWVQRWYKREPAVCNLRAFLDIFPPPWIICTLPSQFHSRRERRRRRRRRRRGRLNWPEKTSRSALIFSFAFTHRTHWNYNRSYRIQSLLQSEIMSKWFCISSYRDLFIYLKLWTDIRCLIQSNSEWVSQTVYGLPFRLKLPGLLQTTTFLSVGI